MDIAYGMLQKSRHQLEEQGALFRIHVRSARPPNIKKNVLSTSVQGQAIRFELPRQDFSAAAGVDAA